MKTKDGRTGRWRREFYEYEKLSAGYGVAYQDYMHRLYVSYPIPFHFMARTWHWMVAWWYRRIIKVDWWDTPFYAANNLSPKTPYQTGYERGHAAAVFEFDQGIRDIAELDQFKTEIEAIRTRAVQEGVELAYAAIEQQLEETSRIQQQCIEELSKLPACKKQAD